MEQIKKGTWFICIKSVFMSRGGNIDYTEGSVYKSDFDGCITDNFDNKSHFCSNKDGDSFIEKHFIQLPEIIKMKQTKEGRDFISLKNTLSKPCNLKLPDHYNNDLGSLYLIAAQRGWDAYQFDIIKRIDRCNKKGEFKSDLIKTIGVIELWLKECDPKLLEQEEKLTKE